MIPWQYQCFVYLLPIIIVAQSLVTIALYEWNIRQSGAGAPTTADEGLRLLRDNGKDDNAIISLYPNSDSRGGGELQMSHPPSFTVDILSVASVNRLDLVSAQKKTFASHKSVRNFFSVTEMDDYDPTCYKDLTMENVRKISKFCKRRPRGISPVMRFLRGQYARIQWLEEKANPVGWMCAQQRPFSGILKAFNHYKETQQQLPNYFIIMDDDSYYNMETIQQHLQDIESTEPYVAAGCLIRNTMGPRQINFTFPFGGFGTIFNKGSLSYLSHPITCLNFGNGPFPMIANHDNSKEICNQMEKNIVGELRYFENGMSLIDLIYKYVNTERYTRVDNWTTGFCMHSDWVIGFFVNFYNVSTHVKSPWYNETRHARIEGYKGSGIGKKSTGVCNNQGNKCTPGSDICHYVSADWMEEETKRWL